MRFPDSNGRFAGFVVPDMMAVCSHGSFHLWNSIFLLISIPIQEGAFDEAMRGVDGAIRHTASLVSSASNDLQAYVGAVVLGTSEAGSPYKLPAVVIHHSCVLNSAYTERNRRSSVKRVVITGSIYSIASTGIHPGRLERRGCRACTARVERHFGARQVRRR